ncbi:MAG: hypothetical protein HOH44_04120, partial [Bacteroidetes bacterium]|nr:hypothetical protein [Bacteroidota bacterium]
MLKFLSLICICFCLSGAISQNIYKQKTYLMGSDFEITVVAKTQLEADKQIAIAINEISRIEALISSWKPTSETSNINKNAGASPVQVSEELFSLIQRALQISNLTDGAFDISYASMDKLWKYDGSMTQMPSKEAIKKSVAKVGYQDIIVDPKNSTVFLKNKGMKIGFGAIGKGYAADKAKKLLISLMAIAICLSASSWVLATTVISKSLPIRYVFCLYIFWLIAPERQKQMHIRL